MQEPDQLAYILAQTVTGSSLQLVMNAEAHNGMESLRLAVQREAPTGGTAQVQPVTAPLQTRFSGRVDTFEDDVQRLAGLNLRCSLVFRIKRCSKHTRHLI